MQSLQCVLVIVNIFFVISHEGVKATLLEKGRACNHSEDNNNDSHEIVEEVASRIYNKYFKRTHDDKKNEVSVIGSLLNALVRNEQEKAEKTLKKEKEINNGNMQLFIFDTKSGRLLGRTGIKIENFLNHMREKFEGSVVITNTMYKPYSPQRPPGGSGNKTSGQDPYSPKTPQGGSKGWKNSGYGPHLPQRPQDGASGWKTSGQDPYAPKTSQGGAGSWKTSGQDPYSPKSPQGGSGGWKTSGQGPYSPKSPQDGSGGWKTSGHNPYSPQKPQAGAGGSKTLSHDPSPKSPQGGSGGWKTSGHNPYFSQKPQGGAGGWKSSGYDPYSPLGPLHINYGWKSSGEGEKGYYESSIIINGRKQ